MRRSKLWLALLGLAAALGGCDRPCETSAQCGGGEVCAAALCQKLSCEQTMFAVDPKTGACVALSGCFLTEEQRGWKTCNDDPCRGLPENACLQDSRCQTAYANPQVELKQAGSGGPGVDNGDRSTIACGGFAGEPPVRTDDGQFATPGVNNGEAPKHPSTLGTGCVPNTARIYAGCRAAPQIEKRAACETLDEAACGRRADCQKPSDLGNFKGAPTPVSDIAPGEPGRTGPPNLGVCVARVAVTTVCDGADATSCLLNPACQPIGAKCYCPPGGACACDGGAFLGCERNDRLRRCRAASDCGAGERCDNDEACIAPRTFTSDPSSGPAPVPGTGSCVGACVPMGCAGLGEQRCHESAECDAGAYGTVCHPKPYCAGGEKPLPPDPMGPSDPTGDPAGGVGATCGCETEFKGCAPAAPVDGIQAERSLLVRDPAIVSDPAFRLDEVIRRLAPAGKADEFARTWFGLIGAQGAIGNGSVAGQRMGFTSFLGRLQQGGPITAAMLAARFHATALVNRIDLATAGDCGEARITYALSDAYTNGSARMTAIFELKVPDDGKGCREVAQRWGELSLIDDGAERLRRLQAIYAELLAPAHLGQIRTNEFLNGFGKEAWELREWRLGAGGMPELAPVKQTVDPRFAGSSDLLGWVRSNGAALKAGTAVIPDRFLAAVSTENGARLRLADTTLGEAEKALNAGACAGCHLTETRSPFTHVGERLGKRVAGGFAPEGRAVIDEFMKKELVSRAANLRRILSAPAAMGIVAPWRSIALARVH